MVLLSHPTTGGWERVGLAGTVIGLLMLAACGAEGTSGVVAAPEIEPSGSVTTTSEGASSTTADESASTALCSSTLPNCGGETTTTTAEESVKVEEGQGSPVNQAEPDLRYDYGRIVRYDQVDGVDWIWFDRYSFGTNRGDLQGPELQSEPEWALATDWHGGSSLDEPLRIYPLALTARILEIDPFDCDDGTVEYVDSGVPRLLAFDFHYVSLTFDEDQRVMRIRDQRVC